MIEIPSSTSWLHEDPRHVSARHLAMKNESNQAKAVSLSGELICRRLSSGFYFVA
jgi:hypothetical protein